MWKKLTILDLKTLLSDEEVQKLNEISTTDPNVVQAVIDTVSDTWRGALKGKGFELDIRDHYTAPEYAYWVLVHARYAVWTRFPMSPSYALDEARKAEYEKALELLENPTLGPSKPDYSDDPEAEQEAEKLKTGDAAIGVPFQRFSDRWYYSQGSVKRIWS